MNNRLVIVSEEMGVYLGNFLGLGFWSKLDAAGQDSAPIFQSEADAINHILSWDSHNNPADYRVFQVPHTGDDPNYATVKDLIEAGLERHVGELVEAKADRASKVREPSANVRSDVKSSFSASIR